MRNGKTKYILLYILLSVVVSLSAVSLKTFAKGSNADQKTVRVAVIDYPNYLIMNDSGTVSGYAYEYLQEIAKHTGWNYEFVRMTFSEAMTALQKGEIDLLPGNQYTEERAAVLDYSNSSMGDGGSVLCIRPEDTSYCYNDYSNYGGMKIAALAGSVRMDQAKAKLALYGVTADFIEYPSDDAAKTALENSEVDAVLMSSIRCESKYKILARMDMIPLYFCTNKKRPELKAQLDQTMETIHLDNPYYEMQLNAKYYGTVAIQLAFTREEKQYIEAAGPITVAVSDDFAPIEYYNKHDKSFHGLVPDMMDLIAQNSGLTFQCVLRDTIEDTLAEVNSGEITLIASVADRPETADIWNVTLTDAYRTNSLSVVINSSSKDYLNMDSLVALKEGYPYLEQAALDEGYHNFCYVNSFAECVKKIHNGDAVLSFIPSNSNDLMFSQNGYEELSAYLLPDSNTDFSIGVSKTADPRLVSILNKSIASISDEEKSVLLIENLNSISDTISLKKFIITNRVSIMAIVIAFAIVIIIIVLSLASERKRTNSRLSAALQEADTANNAKTDFLSRMSHDIRTPMNAIIGLTELAKDEEMSKTAKEYLEKIGSSSNFLLGLINDILDMSKIESGELTLNPAPYHREQFVQAVNTIMKPLMDAKNITFVVEVSEAYECIMVDKLRHNQIFFNLLSNASKFTPPGGRVEFMITPLSPKNGMVGHDYYIRDTGIGMSEEFLTRLFEPFSQEQTEGNDTVMGTGLGLPIVKSLVEAMDGTITVKSELGKGTEFHITLYYPLAQDNTERKQQTICYDNLKGAAILLAEDHPLNAEIAVKLLEKQGCIVTWTKNGKECLDCFNSSEMHHFSLVLMDMRMPVMNGLEATEEIRKLSREDAQTVPIIAMTANAYTEDVEKCLNAGMNGHIAKPVEPARLYDILAKWITITK